jgi:hypothetical protein
MLTHITFQSESSAPKVARTVDPSDPVLLKGAVRRTVFKKYKFLFYQDDLDYGKEVCKLVLSQVLGVNNWAEEKREYWWNENKKTVRSALNLRRNNVSSEIRTAFLGTCRKRVVGWALFAWGISERHSLCFVVAIRHGKESQWRAKIYSRRHVGGSLSRC